MSPKAPLRARGCDFANVPHQKYQVRASRSGGPIPTPREASFNSLINNNNPAPIALAFLKHFDVHQWFSALVHIRIPWGNFPEIPMPGPHLHDSYLISLGGA